MNENFTLELALLAFGSGHSNFPYSLTMSINEQVSYLNLLYVDLLIT